MNDEDFLDWMTEEIAHDLDAVAAKCQRLLEFAAIVDWPDILDDVQHVAETLPEQAQLMRWTGT